ncbi:hypothetical protein [Poseidonibacter ostreae]|uniref:Uncharacterized protein n=1 Tax=Poseidonibacter ostreae TaxID=2654171 RepID=A0A6L4WZ51_9BACT|nr:hypothetical protein [Poseidonibacter ostreae]KAB7891274.1 hypothetical protein GBG19_00125 [Poseidonibacter ostreae]
MSNVVLDDIENIASRFEDEKDSLKAKMRLWIENNNSKPKVTSENIVKNKESLSNSNTMDFKKENNIENESVEVNTTSNATNDNLEIKGESESVIYTPENNENGLDFKNTVTIAEKVEHGYRLSHVDKSLLADYKEDEDFIVLIDWEKVIPETPTLDDVDNIFDSALGGLKENLANKKDLFSKLTVQKDEINERIKEHLEVNDKEISDIRDILSDYDNIGEEEPAPEKEEPKKAKDESIYDDIEEEVENIEEPIIDENEIPDDIASLLGMTIEEDEVAEDLNEDMDISDINELDALVSSKEILENKKGELEAKNEALTNQLTGTDKIIIQKDNMFIGENVPLTDLNLPNIVENVTINSIDDIASNLTANKPKTLDDIIRGGGLTKEQIEDKPSIEDSVTNDIEEANELEEIAPQL